jgi:hypothetical protein
LIFCSSAASCGSREEASKITPHELDALLELGVALLKVLDVLRHIEILHTKSEILKSKLDSILPG